MYVITGATGNTGKIIVSKLLEAGKKVRIISRNAEKAKELTNKGAELFIGDTGNVELLKKAFNGATAVYAMIPFDAAATDYTASQVRHTVNIAEGMKATGVKYSLCGVIVLFDRQETTLEGTSPLAELEKEGLKPYTVVKAREAFETLRTMTDAEGKPVLDEKIYQAFLEHQKQFGVK